MKSVFRFSAIGVLTLAFAGAAFAQDPCADIEGNQAKYAEFMKVYQKTDVEGRKTALGIAKEYVEKWGKCADFKQQVDYFSGYIPKAEKDLNDLIAFEEAQKRYARFNNAAKAKNWDEVYASGKEVLANEKDPKTKLDVTIFLGSIGFDEARNNNDKFNADTIKYAQEALRMIESGATSDNYGLFGITYKTKSYESPAAAKNNAIGWLNFNIGYLKAFREPKELKAALPYLYKVVQTNSAPKSYPSVYLAIGNWYLEEAQKLDDQREEKRKANNNTDNDETKALYALQKGYLDRAADAYARAYNLYGAEAASKAAKDEVYNNLKEFYKFRNNGKDTGLDAFLSSVKTKPMPDPLSEVKPIVEATPAETTTGSTPAPATTMPATTTTKPAATKPATTGTKPAVTTPASTATTAKPAAKKPAPKKKGTR